MVKQEAGYLSLYNMQNARRDASNGMWIKGFAILHPDPVYPTSRILFSKVTGS